jgi:hypothetical protein
MRGNELGQKDNHLKDPFDNGRLNNKQIILMEVVIKEKELWGIKKNR